MIYGVCNSLLNQWVETSRIEPNPNAWKPLGKCHMQPGSFLGPLMASSLAPAWLGRAAATLGCGLRLQAGGQERGLRVFFQKGPVAAIPATLSGVERRERVTSPPAPRLIMTEPKLSPARGIVLPMSFQYKINCSAHQPAEATGISHRKSLLRCKDKSASCSHRWE